MPPRRKGPSEPQAHELEAFAEKYDINADIYGDPIEVVFRIMATTSDEEVKLRAADMLLSYRYPRVKAAEGNKQSAQVLNFNVTMPNKELDVTPRPALAVGK